MSILPPPIPNPKEKRRRRIIILSSVVLAVVVFAFAIFFSVKSLIDSGITKGPDAMFGDQHLKTVVALVELHKVRYGAYPESLNQLKFTGQWDQLALQSVYYVSSPDHSHYFVEVRRGWVAKPKLDVPAEFWHGTGYSEQLKPQ